MIAGYLGSSDKTVMSCIREAISFQVLCADQDEVDYYGAGCPRPVMSKIEIAEPLQAADQIPA